MVEISMMNCMMLEGRRHLHSRPRKRDSIREELRGECMVRNEGLPPDYETDATTN